MNKEIFNELKINLDKLETEENIKKAKKQRIVEIGTQKAYCEIWKHIIKNIKKDYFTIYVSTRVVKGKGSRISDIRVNKIPKLFMEIPVNEYDLVQLFQNDGLDLSLDISSSNGSKKYKMFISRCKLQGIAMKYENSKEKTLK